jgi:hypothetical protein
MMTIILNQQKLADVVHDPDLRHLLATALEYEGGEVDKLKALREYLVHAGLADKIAARPVHDERTGSSNISDEDADE